MNGKQLKPESLHSKPAQPVLADEKTLEWGCDGGVCVFVCVRVGLQMSNCQAELQGHSHKDKSDQGLHQRPDIPQSEGFGEKEQSQHIFRLV